MDPNTVMTGNQHFILQLITVLMGGITTIGTAILAYYTIKIKAKQDSNMQENRENIAEVAKAINGRTTEVVATAKAHAMLEGAKLESERNDSPEANLRAVNRYQEVINEANQASSSASSTASDAVRKILEVPK